MDHGDGLARACRSVDQRWRWVSIVQDRAQVGDDPGKLFFSDVPVEYLSQDSGSVLLGKFLVVEIVGINDERAFLSRCVQGFDQRFRAVIFSIGHFLSLPGLPP